MLDDKDDDSGFLNSVNTVESIDIFPSIRADTDKSRPFVVVYWFSTRDFVQWRFVPQ